MEESVTSNDTPKNASLSKMVKVFAYPASAAAGLWVGFLELNRYVSDKLKKVGNNLAFGDIREKFRPQFEEELKKRMGGLQREDGKGLIVPGTQAPITIDEFIKNDRGIRAEHRAAMAKRTEYLGFGGRESFLDLMDFKSMSNKWHFINKDLKRKVVMEGIAVTAVAVGVLLTVLDNTWLSERFSHKDHDDKSR